MPRGKKDKLKLPKAGGQGYEKTFGFRLDQAMSKRPGMTDRSLAKQLGLSHVTVFFWRHNIAQPREQNLQRLLAALPDLEVQVQPNEMEELVEISKKLKALDEDMRRLVDAVVRKSMSGRSG
jgi:transposase-like protein